MDYRTKEAQAAELREQIKSLTEKPELASEERDAIMRMTGEAAQLDEIARELRDREVEELRTAAERGTVIGEATEDTASADWRAFAKTGEARASMSSTDGNGGYLVPEPVHQAMIDKVYKVSPLMAEATVYNMTGDTKLYIPKKLTHGAVGWVAETDARGETNSPTFGNITLEAFELYANAYATQTVLDTVAGAEAMLLDDIAGAIAEECNAKFAVGTGTGQPTGVWSTAAQSIYTAKVSSTNDALDAAQFFTTYFSLATKYQGNAKWYMKPATLAAVAQLAWPNIADTKLVNWDGSGQATILGKPVVLVDDAPAVGNGAFPAAFGDLRAGYAVGVHKSLSVLRDPFSAKPYVTFYNLARIGGVPTDPAAVLLMKSDAS